MPEICRFAGIIIKMYFADHNPPHFHAKYGEYKATFSIETGLMIQGDFPRNQAALVTAWALLRQKELMKNWGNEPKKILPLK